MGEGFGVLFGYPLSIITLLGFISWEVMRTQNSNLVVFSFSVSPPSGRTLQSPPLCHPPPAGAERRRTLIGVPDVPEQSPWVGSKYAHPPPGNEFWQRMSDFLDLCGLINDMAPLAKTVNRISSRTPSIHQKQSNSLGYLYSASK